MTEHKACVTFCFLGSPPPKPAQQAKVLPLGCLKDSSMFIVVLDEPWGLFLGRHGQP